MKKISQEIDICLKKSFFLQQSLFLKQNKENKEMTLVGVNDNNVRMRRKQWEEEGYIICLYELNLETCMSLILSRDILVPSLFTSTLCLKDDLDISRDIFQSLEPILLHNDLEKAPQISCAWDSSEKKVKLNDNKFSIRFYNISSDLNFIFNVLIPIQSHAKNFLDKAVTDLQFYNTTYRKDAVFSLYFNNVKESRDALIAMQKLLYSHSTELLCQNIRIPYYEINYTPDFFSHQVQMDIIEMISDFQSIVLSGTSESTSSDKIITEMIYVYILNGKILYHDFPDFTLTNNKIYQKYSWISMSDNVRYLISHKIMGVLGNKIAKEYHSLCLENASMLFSNYTDMISEWDSFENCKTDYLNYINKLEKLKIICKKNDHRDLLFEEITKHLFHSFDISAFYLSYIPYCVKFISNEI